MIYADIFHIYYVKDLDKIGNYTKLVQNKKSVKQMEMEKNDLKL